MIATRLRTEFLHNPMGIDVVRPRLQWHCQDGVTQTAFHLVARRVGEVVWDTGKTASGAMCVRYDGETLRSRDAICWHVRLWDESDTPGEWSETASFELGLLEPADWQAAWITGDYVPRTKKSLVGDYLARKCSRYPVDCFLKTFDVSAVRSARLYITACGLYEATLNGRRVGDFLMAPGHTDYRKRVYYQTYDVTPLLREGENRLAVALADGWYRGSTGAWGLLSQYGHETKLLAQLEMVAPDGRITTLSSDASWQWSQDGPIRFADIQDGETVDARLTPTCTGRARVTRHPVTPTASNSVPVTAHETFVPVAHTTPSGKTVLDFGQNLAGILSFRLTAHAGQRVHLRFGEMLDESGEFTQRNIQCRYKDKITPLQQVDYICREGENDYRTTFAVFGFQYVLLETDVPWNPSDFTATAVYSDMEQTGFFECSNPLLDQFVKNTTWSAKGNFLDVPTDCPTRERHGWTGDAQIFCATASYLFDFLPFANKYLADVYDAQRQDGRLPQIAPVGGTDFYMRVMDGSVGWADAGVLMPYRLWKKYGDTSVLTRYYDRMTAYARFMQKRCGKRILISKPLKLQGKARRYAVNCGQVYGEWAEPNDIHPFSVGSFVFPKPEESTAYTSFVMKHMAEIADVLGKTEDAASYRVWAERVRASYQALVELPEHRLDTDRQAKLVRPLYMGLLDERQTAYAKERLMKALERYGWRLGTGFLSTPMILYVLADIELEAAYRLLENEEVPGWLAMPKAGATTVWESWEAATHKTAVDSRNHYSKGAVCEWLFSTMCGIQVAGENRFIIAPRPGGHFTHAHARYHSVYGMVSSGWRREKGNTTYTIDIPPNCTAEIRLPDGTVRHVATGSHVYEDTTQ